ncbi:MAG: gamma-glutamyl-gamma-aminobutyrate hydrolase family protein [Candidatus Eremiobacterota bacterium]
MKRIGLTQRVETVPDYAERRDCLDQRWTEVLFGLGYLPVPLPNREDLLPALLEELELTGVILTGGNDLACLAGTSNCAPERDATEHRLLDLCSQRGLPVLGVCRGAQLMCVHYRGGLRPIQGHKATRHEVHGEEHRDSVNSFHVWGIHNAGPILKVLGRSPDDLVEAVRHPDLPQVGILWHPEREETLTRQDQALLEGLFG